MITPQSHSPAAGPEASPRSSHPPALYRLFFTEMWERFSYYGMRALLVLFMTDAVAHGGMGLDDKTATAIYGIYTGFVYLVALPGGWAADRWFGARNAVWYGGIIIAAGHFMLALPWSQTFFAGLGLVVLGTGLLKPNITSMVGQLYPLGDSRRDAGFTIFYMGINLGAALGPMICSTLAENKSLGWHYGFIAAGVGMVAGVIQYRLAWPGLIGVGNPPSAPVAGSRGLKPATLAVGAVVTFGLVVAALRVFAISAPMIAGAMSSVIGILGVVVFAWALLFGGLTADEKKRVGIIAVLFFASALFWAGFEQAGSSFNLFAERFTQRETNLPGLKLIPTGWFQSLGPVFVIVLSPVMAALWVALGRRKHEPSTLVKFAWGLLFLALGFFLMAAAAGIASSGVKAGAGWLVATYLIHTVGELCLSPVGLSSVSGLAPSRWAGRMIGLWFLATSLGNILAGQAAGLTSANGGAGAASSFLTFALIPTFAGIVLWLCAGRLTAATRPTPSH